MPRYRFIRKVSVDEFIIFSNDYNKTTRESCDDVSSRSLDKISSCVDVLKSTLVDLLNLQTKINKLRPKKTTDNVTKTLVKPYVIKK